MSSLGPTRISIGAAACLFFFVFFGCNLPGTGGELVEVDWRFRSAIPSEGPVVAETMGESPWQVEILEAQILIGPTYAFAPTLAARSSLEALLAPSQAFAHAGDDNTFGARVTSEVLDQFVVDLLDPEPRPLQVTLAEAGMVDSMNVVLDEPRAELSDPEGPTHGGHAWLRAIARRDYEGELQEVRFNAILRHTIPEDRIARRVESVPVDSVLDDGSILELSADPRQWVRQMRFDEWVGSEGEIHIEEPSQLHNAWYLGLRDPSGWGVTVLEPAGTDPSDRTSS